MRSESEAFVEVWDLGDRWCRWAEQPFVFAMWVARAGVDTHSVAEQLARARDDGCLHIAEIAQVEAGAMGLSQEMVLSYLSKNLHFQLRSKERCGLEYFFEKVARLEEINAFHPAIMDSESR